ncbi:MAG: hypothetical protein HOW73_11550 [Polyangiaceae bacterium]|nr:hypothetical protein [Polyangiaceae bacterium]
MNTRLVFLVAAFAVHCGDSDQPTGGSGGSGAGDIGGAGGDGASSSIGGAGGENTGAGNIGGQNIGGQNTGGTGGAGPQACEPTPGDSHVELSCSDMILAVLQGDSPILRVTGKVAVETGVCATAQQVELLDSSDMVVQTLDASGVVEGNLFSDWAAEGPAESEVSDRCADLSGRIEPYEVVVHGLIDGGTFEARCGGASYWPPKVVLTCHEGITAAPIGVSAFVDGTGPGTITQLTARLEADAGLTSAGDFLQIVPFSWGMPPGQPLATPGWAANVMPVGEPDPYIALDYFFPGDPLGTDVCPLSNSNPMPGDPLPPVFIARGTGDSAGGPVETEIYFSLCTRVEI